MKRVHLKELRRDYKIPQNLIAEKAGVSPSYLSLVEQGKRGLSDRVRKVIIEEFNVKNIEDYEYEIDSTTLTNYSFGNKGKVYQAQHIENKIITSEPAILDNSPIEIMSMVIQDYRNTIEVQKNEIENLKKKIDQLQEENSNLKNKI